VKNLINVDYRDMFILPLQQRQNLIEQGTDMLWRQSELTSVLTHKNLKSILTDSLMVLDHRIKELEEEEQYELCYYLQEVCWETYKRMEKEKNDV